MCFEHEMTETDFQDLTTRTASDEVLLDKAFEIASNSEYDKYQRELASLVCKFFDKKSSSGKTRHVAGLKPNQELADELHKQIIEKFKNTKYIPLLWIIFGKLILLTFS